MPHLEVQLAQNAGHLDLFTGHILQDSVDLVRSEGHLLYEVSVEVFERTEGRLHAGRLQKAIGHAPGMAFLIQIGDTAQIEKGFVGFRFASLETERREEGRRDIDGVDVCVLPLVVRIARGGGIVPLVVPADEDGAFLRRGQVAFILGQTGLYVEGFGFALRVHEDDLVAAVHIDGDGLHRDPHAGLAVIAYVDFAAGLVSLGRENAVDQTVGFRHSADLDQEGRHGIGFFVVHILGPVVFQIGDMDLSGPGTVSGLDVVVYVQRVAAEQGQRLVCGEGKGIGRVCYTVQYDRRIRHVPGRRVGRHAVRGAFFQLISVESVHVRQADRDGMQRDVAGNLRVRRHRSAVLVGPSVQQVFDAAVRIVCAPGGFRILGRQRDRIAGQDLPGSPVAFLI